MPRSGEMRAGEHGSSDFMLISVTELFFLISCSLYKGMLRQTLHFLASIHPVHQRHILLVIQIDSNIFLFTVATRQKVVPTTYTWNSEPSQISWKTFMHADTCSCILKCQANYLKPRQRLKRKKIVCQMTCLQFSTEETSISSIENLLYLLEVESRHEVTCTKSDDQIAKQLPCSHSAVNPKSDSTSSVKIWFYGRTHVHDSCTPKPRA